MADFSRCIDAQPQSSFGSRTRFPAYRIMVVLAQKPLHPMMAEKLVERMIASVPTMGVKLFPVAVATLPTIKAMSQPNIIPMTPPIKLSKEDSVRN